eukprot:51368-Chlamydomonas_euryale.AAC.2
MDFHQRTWSEPYRIPERRENLNRKPREDRKDASQRGPLSQQKPSTARTYQSPSQIICNISYATYVFQEHDKKSLILQLKLTQGAPTKALRPWASHGIFQKGPKHPLGAPRHAPRSSFMPSKRPEDNIHTFDKRLL